MRLIDADALKYYGNHNFQYVDRDQIDEAPSIDIVRCSECKQLRVHNTEALYAFCSKWGIEFYPFEEDTRTHGCSWGEREGE